MSDRLRPVPHGAPERPTRQGAQPPAPAAGDASLLTVVIPTRDRGESVVLPLSTVLESSYRRFEVRVIDQSESTATERAVKGFLADPRVRYVRSATRGLSAALNCGLAEAAGAIVAITGDDCEVAPDWLKEMVAPFSRDARIGIVFGNVLPAPHDSARGFVQASVRERPVLAAGIRDMPLIGGTSACMAVRRCVWQALGGFDEMLGVGAVLRAAEDADLTIRALLDGYLVYDTPEAAVVHHGFSRWDQQRELVRRNWYGTGAAFAKPLKRGNLSILPVLGQLGWRWITGGRSPVAQSLDSHRQHWSILTAFVRGFASGALTPLDPASDHYRRWPEGPAR